MVGIKIPNHYQVFQSFCFGERSISLYTDLSDVLKIIFTTNGRYHICDICGKEYESNVFLKLHKEKDHSIKGKFMFSEFLLDEWDPDVAGGNH